MSPTEGRVVYVVADRREGRVRGWEWKKDVNRFELGIILFRSPRAGISFRAQLSRRVEAT